MIELKPCPFCGRVPTIENCKDFGYFVKCKCGIEQSTLYAQRCDAVKRWNKRKTEPQTDKEIILDPSFAELSDEQFVEAMKLIVPQTDCSWK